MVAKVAIALFVSMKMIKKLFGSALITAMTATLASTGVQLDTTRIIMDHGNTAAKYGLHNHNDTPILVSGSVTTYDGKPTTVFAVSPNIYQVPAKKNI